MRRATRSFDEVTAAAVKAEADIAVSCYVTNAQWKKYIYRLLSKQRSNPMILIIMGSRCCLDIWHTFSTFRVKNVHLTCTLSSYDFPVSKETRKGYCWDFFPIQNRYKSLWRLNDNESTVRCRSGACTTVCVLPATVPPYSIRTWTWSVMQSGQAKTLGLAIRGRNGKNANLSWEQLGRNGLCCRSRKSPRWQQMHQRPKRGDLHSIVTNGSFKRIPSSNW